MSIAGEVTSVINLLLRGWHGFRDRLDPAHKQAARLIDAFEAHGIARQQIARLLPTKLDVPSTAFSTPDKLKKELSKAAQGKAARDKAVLDWAAGYLALNRPWLDGLDVHPHHRIEGYKDESVYEPWLRRRKGMEPDAHRCLYIWAVAVPRLDFTGSGYLSLVYVESVTGLDGTELSRYWLLSDHWAANHVPCVESMLKVVAIARSLGIMVIGRFVPAGTLRQLEEGRILAPQAAARIGRLWYPEDLAAPDAR